MKIRMPRWTKCLNRCLLLLIVVLSSCSWAGRIYKKYDQVQAVERYELDLNYRVFDRRSPLLYMDQSIVKEVNAQGSKYSVYDALVFDNLGYQVQNELYLLIDDEVFKPLVTKLEYENTREIQAKSEELMRADSTTLNVVTGYSENNKKITRFSYTLDNAMIEHIRTANIVKFRYYAGPDMITLKLQGRKMRRFKALMDK